MRNGTVAHNPQLDGLRGVAIVLVLVTHATFTRWSGSIAVRALLAGPSMGWCGVDLFFVLSGFLITRILVRERGATNYFAAFYARRALRILPLYYSVVFVCLVVVPRLAFFREDGGLWLEGADREGIWYWVFLGNVHDAITGRFHHAWLAITWSLAIEEHFYAVWPLVVARSSLRALERLCATIIVAVFVGRCVSVATHHGWLFTYALTPFRLDALAVGAWIASRSERCGLPALAAPARRIGPLAGGVLLLAVAALVVDPGGLIAVHRYSMLSHPLMQTVGYSVLAVVAGAVLVRAMTDAPSSRLRRVLESPALRSLGTLSYGLYLLHLPVIMAVRRLVLDPERTVLPPPIAQLAFYAIVFVGSVTAASVSWWALESRMLALRRLVPFRR